MREASTAESPGFEIREATSEFMKPSTDHKNYILRNQRDRRNIENLRFFLDTNRHGKIILMVLPCWFVMVLTCDTQRWAVLRFKPAFSHIGKIEFREFKCKLATCQKKNSYSLVLNRTHLLALRFSRSLILCIDCTSQSKAMVMLLIHQIMANILNNSRLIL